MALALLVVLAPAHLEDADLVVAAVRQTVAMTVAPATRGAPTRCRAAADGEDLIEHDFLADVRSNLFYFNFFAGGNAILLAAGFYDRVHVDLFEE